MHGQFKGISLLCNYRIDAANWPCRFDCIHTYSKTCHQRTCTIRGKNDQTFETFKSKKTWKQQIFFSRNSGLTSVRWNEYNSKIVRWKKYIVKPVSGWDEFYCISLWDVSHSAVDGMLAERVCGSTVCNMEHSQLALCVRLSEQSIHHHSRLYYIIISYRCISTWY